VPVLVMEKTCIADSGGPGRSRGGLGQRVALRKRDADGLPTLASVYPEGVNIETPGLFGGGAGRSARGLVRAATGAVIRDCGTGELVTLTSDREFVEVSLSGGSGFGDPRTRPLAAVAHDLAEGFITTEGAERDYGAVVGHDGKIDVAASEQRRQLGTAAE
jgi:5-oxoprolinase (ATP-hydrolysing)/N-methylhydantoinase A